MYAWNEDIDKIINWIEKNLVKKINLNELSQQIAYSPYYLSSKSVGSGKLKKEEILTVLGCIPQP